MLHAIELVLALQATFPVNLFYRITGSPTLHEPVVVQYTLQNQAPGSIAVDLGWNRTSAFVLTITRPDGTTVTAPPPTASGVGRVGRLQIPVGGAYEGELLLNEWSTFDQVGSYSIQVQLTASVSTDNGATMKLPPTTLTLDIRSRDVAALDEKCRQLANTAAGGWGTAAQRAAELLAVVNDPIAVGHMRSVLLMTEHFDFIIFGGLVKLNTEESRVLLTEMAQTGVGERAQQAQSSLQFLQRRQ